MLKAASNIKANLELAVIFSMAAVFIVLQLTHWQPLTAVLGCLVFAAIALFLRHLRGLTLWLTVAFMTVGVLLLLVQRAEAGYWFDAASVNVTLVTLFVFAPLFGIPVRLPAYMDALKRFYETRLRSRFVLFGGTQLLTQIMGVFLNVGSIPVVYHMVFAKAHPGMALLLANALNRGFAGAILWSPYFAAMAVVLSSLSVEWTAILPYMLGLAVVSLLVSIAVDFKELRKAGGAEAQEEEKHIVSRTDPAAGSGERSVFPAGLAVYLIGAIVVILVLERMMELPMVLLTCLAAVVYPLIWCLGKRAMATYRQGLANHLSVTLPALKKEMTLFLAAGFFSGSIGIVGFGDYVPVLLEWIPLPVALSFSILTIVMVMVTSIVGLHPIVLVTILATGIEPAAVQMSANEVAVLLLGSWCLSNGISPSSAVNNLLAGLYRKSVYELARPNYKFAAWMGVALLVYLAIMSV
ncbi:hypothetical protein [Paenibacillus soyae]|uniref:C4-dicarboxylate ABC transporter n=1 Tax=Paenibacillus soyae TaxID=2969249 RepID=A0A9X2MSJ8_9BACL|nr:hypothetical protein [Paenibacillus soyae]MCR2807373.1 hypothetical protein [Paenibacillus soyae]